jgi:hypothetical protein
VARAGTGSDAKSAGTIPADSAVIDLVEARPERAGTWRSKSGRDRDALEIPAFPAFAAERRTEATNAGSYHEAGSAE